MDADAQTLAYSFVPLNKSLKLLTTASFCVYPDFQDCSLMFAKSENDFAFL